MGRTIHDLRLWADPREFDDYRNHIRTDGKVRNMEFHFLRRNGELATGLISGEPIELEGKTCRIAAILDITERRDAEKQFRDIFDGAVEGIYRTSPEGQLLAANLALATMLGYVTANEFVSSINDAAHQLWLEPNERIRCAALLEQHTSVRGFETQFKRKDGTALWASINGRRVCGVDGQTLYYDGFVQDVTERKRMEEALRKSEEKFSKLFLSSPAVTILFTPGLQGNRIADVNEAFEQGTGYRRDEAIGRTTKELGLWADAGDFDDFMNRFRAVGRVRNFEHRVRKKNGDIGVGLTSAEVVVLDDLPYAISATIDLTEQKRAEQAIQQANEALAKAERHYRLMFNSVSDALFVHNFGEDGLPSGFHEVNDNACRHLGYTREELLGLWPDDIDAPEERIATPARAQRIIADGHLMWEGIHIAKDGRRIPVEINTHLVDLDGEQTIISCVRDISQRKVAEKQYRDIFEGAVEGIYQKVPYGGFLSVNPAFLQIFGYESVQDILNAFTDSTHELWTDPNERLRFLQLLDTTGVVSGYECQAKRKDGTEIWVSLSAHKVCGTDGRILYHEGFVKDITERKRSEAVLREHDRLLTASQKIAGLGSYALDIVTGTWTSSLVLDNLFGIDAAFTRSVQGWLSLVHPEWREKVLDHFTNEVIGEHQRFDKEYKIVRHSDGQVRWVHGLGELECDAQGQPVRMVGTILDVTERKRMEDALRKSEETLSKLFRSSPTTTMLFKLVDTEYRVGDVNEAFEQRTGYRREEVVGRTMEELGLWADPNEGLEYMKRFRANGRVTSFEHTFRTKNGDIGVCLSSAESIEIDGCPCAIAATIDITKQKQVEDTMRSLVTAIEQSADTIVITDLHGVIQYCNPAFERVTGYSKEEVIGQTPRMLKSGKHDSEFYRQMWATITKGLVWSGHLTNKRKDGSLYEESATISPIRDTSGKITGFVAVKRDVTERLQLQEQLRQAQKLESIGRLAGGVAHDFNNLLTVINGYSRFLLKGLNDGDPLRIYADEISTAGERAASLTSQLLAFSRKQVIEPRVFDLNSTIRRAVPMLQRLIGEDIALKTHLDDSLGWVFADPDQMHQVIMNLAVNARDAMPDGGRLDIETSNVEVTAEGRTLFDPNALPGRYVLVTVTDNGNGMDETTRQKIFEPFFTTKGLGRGTGLGLATVYGIIRQGGGWIDVSSELGVGTSFKVYLPQAHAGGKLEKAVASRPTVAGVETIVVVEDEESVRSFAVAALKQYGYHVIEAADGNEALAIAERHLGPLHLLLTDVVMPGMNGRELSERLKALHSNVKVLFISGYTADVIAHRGVLDPGVAFLHKPFSSEELAAKVRDVLAEPSNPIAQS
jgi:PAS domain S-box-containing protein